MINALIIDDEPYCCEVLLMLLERHCPDVKVLAMCSSAMEGMKAIRELKPSLVFLDVEMPRMNGFEMLEQLSVINFDLVFTTSYDQYALKAIRFSAIDYLLKPIDRAELEAAVKKVLNRTSIPTAQQLEILLQKMNHTQTSISRVAMPTMEGLLMVAIADIVACESDSNYTIVKLKDNQKIVVSRTLKEIEEMLEDHAFLRIHHSHLVNLNEVNRYVKGEGGYVVMTDGSNVDVSRSKKDNLVKRLLHS